MALPIAAAALLGLGAVVTTLRKAPEQSDAPVTPASRGGLSLGITPDAPRAKPAPKAAPKPLAEAAAKPAPSQPRPKGGAFGGIAGKLAERKFLK